MTYQESLDRLRTILEKLNATDPHPVRIDEYFAYLNKRTKLIPKESWKIAFINYIADKFEKQGFPD